MSPPPLPSKPEQKPKQQIPPTQPMPHYRTPSCRSELHLGLGIESYDAAIKPGPSPPPSPPPEPRSESNAKALPLPPSPLTPSRAPPKAAKLLGAEIGLKSQSVKAKKVPKKVHYRPLPTQTLVEIERFLGNIPVKPKSAHHSRKPNHSHVRANERNEIGTGGTVRYKDEHGIMWMDKEEEQEFAWLMSEISVPPQPLPKDMSSKLHLTNEESWGMQAFTSVLNMPRQMISVSASKAQSVSKAQSAKRPKEKGESFMDFDDTPSPTSAVPRRPARTDAGLSPWFGSVIIPPARGTSRPAFLRTDSSESKASSSGSGKRRKASPPPLKLEPRTIHPNLPVISRTPDDRKPSASHTAAATVAKARSHLVRPPAKISIVTKVKPIPEIVRNPNTPFVRPRRAPLPTMPLPTQPLPAASLPSLDGYIPYIIRRAQAYDGHLPYSPSAHSYGGAHEHDNEGLSFFDPVTPTTTIHHMRPTAAHRIMLSGGSTVAAEVVGRGANGVKSGGAWLKKVVSGRVTGAYGVRI